MATLDVLLTDAGTTPGLQIMRSLSERGLRIGVCDPSGDGISFRSKYPKGRFKTPYSQDEWNFVKRLKEIVFQTGATMIIPVFHPEVLSKYRDEFPGVIIPVESPEKIILLDNKLKALELADRLDIPQPRRYADPDSVDHYPVVFKRVGGYGGDSVYFPKFRKALDNLAGNSFPGTYVITEEIAGCDVCVDALRWDGRFAAGAYKVILPRAKGASVLRESINAPEIIAYARRILESLDYQGVCGFDFRMAPDGKFYFLECNPRFSGGLCSQIASGFDIPYLLYLLAEGETVDFSSITVRTGVRTQSFSGTLDYLKRCRRQGKLTLELICTALFNRIRRWDDSGSCKGNA